MTKVKKTKTRVATPTPDEKLPVVLITSCTASQSTAPHPDLVGSSLPSDLTNEEAAAMWCGRIKTHEPTIPPARLYRGVSFYSISRSRTLVEPSNIHIISIGQGLVGLEQPIVPYDISVDPNHRNSLARVVTAEVFKPQFWWQLINENLRGTPFPITKLACEASRLGAKLIVVACTNRFQSLITEDLMELVQTDEAVDMLRIVCGSTSGLPNHLKPFAIVYDKRMNRQSIGNRNDFNQRAALNFLRMLHDVPSLLGASLEEHRTVVQESLDKIAPPTTGGTSTSAGLEAVKGVLEGNDLVLAMSPDAAYAEIQQKHKISVSVGQFRKVWRQVKGLTAGGDPSTVLHPDHDAAKRALAAISGSLNRATGSSWADEEESLAALKTFVELVREMPDATFGSAEVYAWAQQYYAELDKSPPAHLKSVGKLAHLLRTYRDDLGLEAIGSGSQQGGNVYRVLQEAKS